MKGRGSGRWPSTAARHPLTSEQWHPRTPPLPFRSSTRVSSLALVGLVVSALAAAQVDPARAFYAVTFSRGSPNTGVITVQDIAAPFCVVATAACGTLNGAITLDPVHAALYGGTCCTAKLPIQAYDPLTRARRPALDIAVTSSGLLSLDLDARGALPRRHHQPRAARAQSRGRRAVLAVDVSRITESGR